MASAGISPRPSSKGRSAISNTASPAPSHLKTEHTKLDSEDERKKMPASPMTDTPRASRRLNRQISGQAIPKEQIIGGSITVKQEDGEPLKLARSSPKRVSARSPPKFSEQDDVTKAACATFDVLGACTYVNKYIGTTEAALECECRSEWDPATQTNHACGDSSDCINRATKMECPIDDCSCGSDCQNQRITRRQYADVSVIQTDRKGHGLRVNTVLPAGAFIYEYIGEVIGQSQFQRRLEQYDHEGIKHFYFMSLNKDEFIDATKKGNLGRFCNHSCNPNCYVDKWVVHDRLRMGIFAERDIEAGEELTFNYNVDRYGAEPQNCYCGEPNCVGVIGGKTQTNRGPALPIDTIEALGLEDAEDWDLVVAKKGRNKKKTGEIDEEYIENVPSKSLSAEAVAKVLTTLRQNKERWIAKKLLDRLLRAEDEQIRHRIVRMHGYQVLKSAISIWKEDDEIVLQIFRVLGSLPMITRNKIQKSGIEEVMKPLLDSANPEVATGASTLMEIWSKLELAFRIQKRDPALKLAEEKADRELWRQQRDQERAKQQREKSVSPPKGPSQPTAPSGPRSTQKPGFGRGRGNFRGGPPRVPGPPLGQQLPFGWLAAFDASAGKEYYYHEQYNGLITWEKPTPENCNPWVIEMRQRKAAVDSIIAKHDAEIQARYEKAAAEKKSSSNTPTQSGHQSTTNGSSSKSSHEPKSEESRKLAYENLINPVVIRVFNKYSKDMGDREEAKKMAKQIGKKIVASDFKHNRINVKELDEQRQNMIKKACHDFFRAAVSKRKAHVKAKEAKHASRTDKEGYRPTTSGTEAAEPKSTPLLASAERMQVDEAPSAPPSSSGSGSERKRKRGFEETPSTMISPDETGSEPKRVRST